jgi:photosystem II stability/assembly factor-like uncharacterized protein
MDRNWRFVNQNVWRLFITTTIAACTLVGVIAYPDPVLASTSFPNSTYDLYVGHSVGVAATSNPNTGCSEVFLTSDFKHWRNITPPIRVPSPVPKGQCLYVWTSAYFTSSTDGWLLARNGGSTDTILRHTLDGGRTWTTQPGGDTGSNGGWETISFTNSSVGWRQQFGDGSNGHFALQRTLNAGTTWATRSRDPHGSCVLANDVFSSASVGFAAAPQAPALNSTHLWQSRDGGLNWSVLTFAPPPALPRAAAGLYGEPKFSGSNGVVSVDYPVNDNQAIYFYGTHNGGLSWKLEIGPDLPVVVSGKLKISHEIATQPCTLDNSAVSGQVAIVALANPTTWWVLRPGPKGATTRLIVTGSGTGITTYTVNDLPTTIGHPELAALNAEDALLSFAMPAGYTTTYETSNGGATWAKVNP